MTAVAVTFATAVLIGLGLLAALALWPGLAGRNDPERAVQRSHHRAAPRLGGIGVLGALAMATVLVPSSLRGDLLAGGLGLALVFALGLAEDLGRALPPSIRLRGVAAAALVAVLALGAWLPRTDIPGLDLLMPWALVGVPMTLFVLSGMTHGLNLVDGVNGLAGTVALCGFAALSAIAVRGGAPEIAAFALLAAGAAAGFLVLNFPVARLFLGDSGAYILGFALGWTGILLLRAAPEVSAWAVLLAMFWPFIDTLVAILRRLRLGRPRMQPDRMHGHQVAMRGLEILWLGRGRRALANPLTTLILLPFLVAPAATGVMLHDRPGAAFLAVLAFGAIYAASYGLGLRLLSAAPRRARPGR